MVATVSSRNLNEVGFNVKKVIFLISVSPFFHFILLLRCKGINNGKREAK